MRLLLLLCAATLVIPTACSKKAKTKEKKQTAGQRALSHEHRLVKRADYQLPIPSGYTIADPNKYPKLSALGVVLVGRPFKGGYRPSIMVGPVPNYDVRQKMTDAICSQTARMVAATSKAKVGRAGVFATPKGIELCQYSLLHARGVTVATVMLSASSAYIVNCTQIADDEVASRACSLVLYGWKFTSRA